MVALNGLNSASSLLQQLATRTMPAPGRQESIFSSAPTLKDEFLKGVSAEKMVGSAIFDALASLSEKHAETTKYVLDYIENTYAKIEESFPTLAEASKDAPGASDAVANHKKAGEALKEYVLNNPRIVHEMLQKIMASRPELSKETAMPFLMLEIGEKINGKAAAKD